MNLEIGVDNQEIGQNVDPDKLAQAIQFQKEKGLTPYDAITGPNQLWEMGIRVVPRLEKGEVIHTYIVTLVDVSDRWIISSVIQGTCLPKHAVDLLEEAVRKRGPMGGHSLVLRPSLDSQFYNSHFRDACRRLGITFEEWPGE